MLRLFRHIRKRVLERGNFGSYGLYAVGEISLLVIGILIALQANNWNEDRKRDHERVEVLENLRADVVEQIDRLQYFIELLEGRARDAESVLEVLSDPPAEVNPPDVIERIVKVGWILVYEPTFATYNEIESSGKLSLIESQAVKKALAAYRDQVVDANQISRAYDAGLKDYERMAIGYLSATPPAQDGSAGTREKNSRIRVDLSAMAADRNLVSRIRHIAYHTRVEVGLIEGLILPLANDLVSRIDDRLGAREGQGERDTQDRAV